MNRKQKQLVYDFLFLFVSIAFAFYISKSGLAHDLIAPLGGLKWFGIVLAGMFFTSIFTTAPAIIILGQFAETTPLPLLILVGAMGATFGDYFIFKFVRDRMTEDLKYLLSFTKSRRFSQIFKTKFFHFFMPFLGAIIIASPLPDELGVAMLGISKMTTRFFLTLSFLANGAGILTIALIARSLV